MSPNATIRNTRDYPLYRLLNTARIDGSADIPSFVPEYVDDCFRSSQSSCLWGDEDLLARTRISVVQLMKQRSGSRDEYIRLYITLDGQECQDTRPFGVIIVERTVRVEYRAHTYGCCHGDFVWKVPYATTSDPEAVSRPLDRLIVQPSPRSTRYTNDRLVYEYKFRPQDAPSLTHLAAAASTLTTVVPEYIARERLCCWYAGMLFRLLVSTAVEDTDRITAMPAAALRNVKIGVAYPRSKLFGVSWPRSVAVKVGSFRTVFQLVTRKDVDALYTGIEKVYQVNLSEISHKVEDARATALQPAREAAAARAETAALRARYAELTAEGERLRAEVTRRTLPSDQ